MGKSRTRKSRLPFDKIRMSQESLASTARKAFLLLVLAVVPALGAAWFHPQTPERTFAPEVTGEQVRNWGEFVILLDARTAEEFAHGHLSGAVLVNEDDWGASMDRFLQAWQPGIRIVVYCGGKGCAASHSVAMRLTRESGIGEIYVLSDGIGGMGGMENFSREAP